MTKCIWMSCGGLCRSIKSYQSTLPSLRICTIMLWQVFEQVTQTLMTFQLIYDCINGQLWGLIYLLWWWMMLQETYKVVSLGVCSLQMIWFWWMRVGWGLTRSWSCGGKLWRQKVLDLVGLKLSTWSVISVLPHKRREMLNSIVRWYPKKTHFSTWDWCSRRMEISMKMLVIELKLTG
jgi:hypothetical protein